MLLHSKMSCCICLDDLTIDTVINTQCGHQFCKDCFWKWMKNKNTCPLCRKDILFNDDELREQRNMQELLDHRSSIVKQVEESYDVKDKLDNRIRILQKKSDNLEIRINSEKYPFRLMELQIKEITKRLMKKEEETKKNRIELSKELKYVLYKYVPSISVFKIKIQEYKKILERKERRLRNNDDVDLSNELAAMFGESQQTNDFEQQILAEFERDYMTDIIINNDIMNNIPDIRSFLENIINGEPPSVNEMFRYDLTNINRNNYINIM